MGRIRLGRARREASQTRPEQRAEHVISETLEEIADDALKGELGKDLHAAAQRVAEQHDGWSTLTGVHVDIEHGSLTAWCATEPITLAIPVSEYEAAHQVAAVATLNARGVPVRIHARGPRVTITTSCEEFGMHSVTGTPRLP